MEKRFSFQTKPKEPHEGWLAGDGPAGAFQPPKDELTGLQRFGWRSGPGRPGPADRDRLRCDPELHVSGYSSGRGGPGSAGEGTVGRGGAVMKRRSSWCRFRLLQPSLCFQVGPFGGFSCLKPDSVPAGPRFGAAPFSGLRIMVRGGGRTRKLLSVFP